MHQLPIPFTDRRTIRDRFREFHAANPQVYDLFKMYAKEVRNAGQHRYSADAILHRIRWHHAVEIQTTDFKINNDFAAHYARLLIADDGSFAEFFEMRNARSCS